MTLQKVKKLLIIGAGGHGKVVADIAKRMGVYSKIAFRDDDKEIKSVLGYPCEGTISELEIEKKETEVFVAIGNAVVREKVTSFVRENGFKIPTLVHPNAVIGDGVQIGCGTVVMAGVVINADARIGRGVIVNTSSSIDHDCVLGDFTHIAVGAHVAGSVKIGKGCWIGAGAVLSNDLSLASGVTIGVGAVVIRDITEVGTYVGVPVRKL